MIIFRNTLLSFAAILLCSCQTGAVNTIGHVNAEEIAAEKTCEQINKDLQKVDQIIAVNTPSQTEELVKNTAASAAKTGITHSGILGGAGAFAGLGINFLSGLYEINADERTEQALENAYYQRDILLDASSYKGCT